MKRCLISLIIKEMQITTTMRYRLIAVRMVIINKPPNKCRQGCGEKGALVHCWEWLQINGATTENSMKVPQKIKNKTTIWPSKTLILKDICTHMFAVAFAIAKTWKEPQCPLPDKWRNVVHIYNETLLSHKKEWNLAICNNMDEPRGYYVTWSKSDQERQIPYDFTYLWNLKNKINEQTK